MYKLTRKVGFSHVLKAGKIKNSDAWSGFFISNLFNRGRLGIIARKKDFPKAVERNKIKRVVREKFRQHSISKDCLDIVVIAKMGLLQKKQVKEKLQALFDEIKINALARN